MLQRHFCFHLFIQSYTYFSKTFFFFSRVANSLNKLFETFASLTAVFETLHETPIVFRSLSFSFSLRHFLMTLIFPTTCKKEYVKKKHVSCITPCNCMNLVKLCCNVISEIFYNYPNIDKFITHFLLILSRV